MSTDPLAGRDLRAEFAIIDADLARKRALAHQRVQLEQLEARPGKAERLLGRFAAIQQQHAARVAAIDPDLRREVADRRRSEIMREAATAGDAIHREILAEVEAARAEAERLADARRVRRRARFDASDASRDALIGLRWQMRLDSAPADVLADWAAEAAEVGDLALLAAVEEALDARPQLDSGSPNERAAAAAIREAVNSYIPPQVEQARKALAAVERAAREMAENLRLLRGGRETGAHQIREGLHARREGRTAQPEAPAEQP